MHLRIRTPQVLSILLLAAAGLPLGQAAEPATPEKTPSPGIERVYRTQFLRGQDGPLIAHQACLALPGTPLRPCTYRVEDGSWFVFRTDEEGHRAIAAALARADAAPQAQSYRVTLLRASAEAAPAPSLPAGETRALEGARQVLPFRGYRVIDAGFLRTAESGALTLASDSPGAVFRIQMELRRDTTATSSAMNVHEFAVKRRITGTGQEEWLLQTSFWINSGETVVVGTSRLNSDSEALVVLLTAGE